MKPEELEKLRHKNRIIEIKADLDARIKAEEIKFDLACQLQRIRNADIRRTIDRRQGDIHSVK